MSVVAPWLYGLGPWHRSSSLDGCGVLVIRTLASLQSDCTYYFSTHGCRFWFSFWAVVFEEEAPIEATAAARALLSKKLAIFSDKRCRRLRFTASKAVRFQTKTICLYANAPHASGRYHKSQKWWEMPLSSCYLDRSLLLELFTVSVAVSPSLSTSPSNWLHTPFFDNGLDYAGRGLTTRKWENVGFPSNLATRSMTSSRAHSEVQKRARALSIQSANPSHQSTKWDFKKHCCWLDRL